jgi:hypothetical protein
MTVHRLLQNVTEVIATYTKKKNPTVTKPSCGLAPPGMPGYDTRSSSTDRPSCKRATQRSAILLAAAILPAAALGGAYRETQGAR